MGDFFDDLVEGRSTADAFFAHMEAERDTLEETPSVAARRDAWYFPRLSERVFDALIDLKGKSMGIYLLLLRKSRVERSLTITLTSALLRRYRITRDEKAYAVQALEEAGLITVQRQKRKNPKVTLCSPQARSARCERDMLSGVQAGVPESEVSNGSSFTTLHSPLRRRAAAL